MSKPFGDGVKSGLLPNGRVVSDLPFWCSVIANSVFASFTDGGRGGETVAIPETVAGVVVGCTAMDDVHAAEALQPLLLDER